MSTSLAPPRQALARLHQMAGLDFTGPEHIEPVLHALRGLIGFDSGGYLYPDEHGELHAHMQSPELIANLPHYFDPRMERNESQLFRRSPRHFAGMVRHEHGPHLLGEVLTVSRSELLRSDYWNEMLRPAGVTDWLTLVLRTAQGRGVGMVFLYRHGTFFSQEDAATLAQLEGHLSRILQVSESDAADSEVQGQGIVVVTPRGRPLWVSPEAEALMRMAFGWHWRHGADMPPVLLELLRRLQAEPARKGWPAMALPALEIRNVHGSFSLRATRMADATGQQPDRQAAALHVTRRVAHSVQLLSALGALKLPLRQHEMAWWLARGLSENQIAQRMGISINTAVYHRRQLYNRLGVASRDNLLVKVRQGYAPGHGEGADVDRRPLLPAGIG
ncbi:helix-turn-helix transcriptional regulator [Diaphorobacter ruginosibacter]|nr:helix-turn-helix transcriptional regulator [Diaphorobacter ruginosibacter]